MPPRLLSLAPLTLADLSAEDFVRTAATAGFDRVGLRTIAGAPDYLPEDMACLIRNRDQVLALKPVLAGEGVVVSEIEFALVGGATRIEDYRPGLERGAELGASYVVASSDDADEGRRIESVAALAALAAEYAMRVVIEFVPWRGIKTLPAAAGLARNIPAPGVGIVIDTLHFDRSGGDAADIADFDASLFPYVQLSDAPGERPTSQAELQRQSSEARLDPGQGGLDLAGVLRALPAGLPISLEVPNRARVAQIGAVKHAAMVRRAALALLRAVDGGE